MPTKQTVDTSTTSFTMSYGGVDFRLTPTIESMNNTNENDAESAAFISILQNGNSATNKSEDHLVVRLANFTGVLRVLSSSNVNTDNEVCEDESVSIREEEEVEEEVNAKKMSTVPSSPPSIMSLCEENLQRRHPATPSPPHKSCADDAVVPLLPPFPAVPTSEVITPCLPPITNKRASPSETNTTCNNGSPKPKRKNVKRQKKQTTLLGAVSKSRGKSCKSTAVKSKAADRPRTPTMFQTQSSTVSCLDTPTNSQLQQPDDVGFSCSNEDDEKEDVLMNVVSVEKQRKSLSYSNDEVEEDKRMSENESESTKNTMNSVVELESSLSEEEDGNFEEDETKSEVPEMMKKVKGDTLNVPEARWGHTLTMIDHHRLVVYGGQGLSDSSTKTFSDLRVFDLDTRNWSKPINCEGLARCWHTSTFLPERNLLISFGGESTDADTGKTKPTDKVMVLDTEIMLWYPPTVTGKIPTGRSGHTATLLPDTGELVVFGGVKNSKWLNTISVLDTHRWKWSNPKLLGNAPRPRSYHSATCVRNRIVIFGGNDDGTSFDTVHVLDTRTTKWEWIHPTISGEPPKARTGHTATLLEDDATIMVYGGWDPNDDSSQEEDDDEVFMDCYLLDTTLWSWTKGPNPKYFGGVNGVPNAGPRRVGHSAVLAPGEQGAHVLAFGGRILNDEFASDFQSLTLP